MTKVPEDRREMVALNADVVGYSRLLADDYEATTAARAEYRRGVDSTVASHAGTVANFVGDSFMAVFDTAEQAVGAAIAITTEIETRNAPVPDSQRVRFRMGIEQGEVGVTDGGYHGDALNIAARIQAIARPGGVSVSGGVYRTLDEPALRFRPLGRQNLRNIPEHVEVYELSGLPSDAGPAPDPKPLALEIPTLAVLPIHTERVDERVQAAASIIRQDLIHRLVRVPQLRVLDATLEPRVARDEHAARYMLETGVHQFGDQVRVYTALFDVTTMNVVKSHKWMARADDLVTLSDEVAYEVARAIEVELIVGEPAGLYAELDDPEAIENVYRGWFHLRTDTPEGWTRALELFERVARSHPDQPFGFVLSAFALLMGASSGWAADNEATLADARRWARDGADRGDPTGLAQAVEAAILMFEGKHHEALAAMENLEITRSTCDVTYGVEGSVRRYLGDWQRAVELLDVAMRLTGINKPWYPTVKASSLFVGGKLEQASTLAEMVLEYQPHNLEALLVLAASQMELGMERRARATVDLIQERFPSADVATWLDKSPYESREIVERWKGDLASAGAIEEPG